MKLRSLFFIIPVALVAGVAIVWAAAPTTINDFFLPGSQPNQSGTIENPDRCLNCHAGYDTPVEPGFNWQGSMMAQAARDPLFFACMAIANQDAPESGDLCIRCHSPKGWLEGRSEPTDGSLLTADDRQGLQCDFCHRLVKPSGIGVNPYPGDSTYTSGTYPADQAYLGTLTHPPATEANGMYVVTSDGNAKRGPFAETTARHAFLYSPFHSDAALCGTCHDVSNPAFSKDQSGKYVPNAFDSAAPDFDPYSMFPVERTYSEWKVSAYNTPQGVYAPQFGGNKDTVRTCQDCHVRDVTGKGCDKADAPIRQDLPLHDMTGGNTFIPLTIEEAFPGETNPAALDSGVLRARRMLQLAASMQVSSQTQGNGHLLNVQVTNETGHKLPSGYPEGRRIWINVRAYNSTDDLIYESGAYDAATAVLTHDADVKIYEIKPGLSQTLAPVVGLTPGVSFHFVLNDSIYGDNRIPPRGFTNAAFDSIQSGPVAHSYADGQYWDDTEYLIPGAAARATVRLYYQTTTKEYVEFLRDENVTNHWGQTLYDLWNSNGKSSPELMNTQTILLTPIAGNQPPILDPIGPKAVDEGVNLNFGVTASDPDGPTPILSAAPLPSGATFAGGVFDWTPTFEQAGVYEVVFKATDDSAAVDSEVVAITVNNVNRAPVLASIGPKMVQTGTLLQIAVSATDPDGTTPGLAASPLPTGADFTDNSDGTGLFSWTPEVSQEGVHNVWFSASDGSLADSELVAITVTASPVDQPPVFEPIADDTVMAGLTVTLVVQAYDPEGLAVQLAVVNPPENSVFTYSGWNGTTLRYEGTFEWTPAYAQAGVHEIQFSADDGVNVVDQFVTFTVEPYLCGDANGNGAGPDVADLTFLIAYLFRGGAAPPIVAACDANGDGEIKVSDLTHLIGFLFRGGPAPICEGTASAR